MQTLGSNGSNMAKNLDPLVLAGIGMVSTNSSYELGCKKSKYLNRAYWRTIGAATTSHSYVSRF